MMTPKKMFFLPQVKMIVHYFFYISNLHYTGRRENLKSLANILHRLKQTKSFLYFVLKKVVFCPKNAENIV
jgi:hypothetical protein